LSRPGGDANKVIPAYWRGGITFELGGVNYEPTPGIAGWIQMAREYSRT
jgi:hypothetical protein